MTGVEQRTAHPAGEQGTDSLLAGVRRLGALADRAQDAGAVLRALAAELTRALGAAEVHVHHLSRREDEQGDLVLVYLFGGESRLSYLCPRGERPPAVSWVANTAQSFLASGQRELQAGVPRLADGPAGARQALLCPLTVRGETAAVVVIVMHEAGALHGRSVDHARALVDQAATVIALLQARAEAGTDAVTGCMNHRAMRRRLREEVARAQRAGGALACLLIDLDDFKLVNDHHGHQAGDAVLRAVAETLMGEFRAFDRVARYGGDEFVAILPDADLQSALSAGERALSRLLDVRVAGAPQGISASIGVAQWRAGMGVQELLEDCDAALLSGKREGKRRVTALR